MIPRRPGQFLEERINRKAIAGLKVLAVSVPFLILGFLWWPFSLLALVPMGYILYQQGRGRALDWTNDEKGLDGERQVGRLLESLAPRVLVVHDFDIRWGNADHVAIAPTGVFAIEVKNWRGRFSEERGHVMFYGQPVDKTTKQVVRSACRIHDVLAAAGFDVFVQGVLVSTKATVMTGGFEVGQVKVIPLAGLENMLSGSRPRLTPAKQAGIRAALLNGVPIEGHERGRGIVAPA